MSEILNPVELLGKHVIHRGDRLYDPINDLLIILAAIGHAASMMVGGRTHRTEKPVMRLNCPLVGHAFAIPLRGPLEMAILEQSPVTIEIGITPLADEGTALVGAVAQTGGLHTIVNHVIAPIFLLYFERYNHWLTDHYGDAVNWPMTLNFARVVRNAVAHGSINIRNPGAPPVHWHALTYSYADSGRKIMGTDLKIGEILALMFEIDNELNLLKVPVL